MPCGHVISTEMMTGFLRSLIDKKMHVIRCPAKKPNGQYCNHEWDFSLCKRVGVLTKEE